MPLYMSTTLEKQISPELKKRMQGKTCFNFKTTPDPKLITDLKKLTAAAVSGLAKFNQSTKRSGETITHR